ncbi:Gfo/Idh/MocA family oxidoreductase [Saccharicrinis sp. FJH62]|uniref:Gfo/Idh/MocA family oxidoreductase n=1 Tax=Saccharicrinis sp. FJH62 TaxID=3344657 RepID=UPI0035D44A71
MSKNISKQAGSISRRNFVTATGTLAAGIMLAHPASNLFARGGVQNLKKKVALVGTGIRGIKTWGKFLTGNYSDVVEYVGLCDINPGRVEYAKNFLGLDCKTFTSFDDMISSANIDLLIVTTVDATHDEFIIKGLNKGINVVTEKPMTTDEKKCQAIIEADKNSSAKLIMGFNYRYGHLFTKLKELLLEDHIGKLTSVDFNWYLNTYHGASYFRRWHGERDKSGTLLLHKSSHHFDLLNWWIGSDPVEVHAFGGLEKYGKNNAFRGKRCMTCDHQDSCQFFWDMREDKNLMKLYYENEKYDNYIRDNCLWRNEIDIFDKMAVQIKYANNVQVSYSLSAYSPYEGFRIAFNGLNGRLETWEGIPSMESIQEDQSQLHEKEMSQNSHTMAGLKFHEIIMQKNFKDYKRIEFPYIRSGHWGGDKLMFDAIYRNQIIDPDLHHAANVRDGSMAVLIGIAARKSIDEDRAIKIADLTSLVPRENKWI